MQITDRTLEPNNKEARLLMMASDVQPEQQFVGGMRWVLRDASGNISSPFVRLLVQTNGLTLAPRWGKPGGFLSRLISPTLEIPFAEVNRVERVRGLRFGGHGVRILTQGTDKTVIFWSSDVDRVLDTFESRGLEVDRKTHPA